MIDRLMYELNILKLGIGYALRVCIRDKSPMALAMLLPKGAEFRPTGEGEWIQMSVFTFIRQVISLKYENRV